MTVVEFKACNDVARMSIIECMAVNSTAELTKEDDGALTAIGNPTECALLRWLKDGGNDYVAIRDNFTVTAVEPFSTETKYMAMEVVRNSSGQRVRFVKGAPEIVMAMCEHIAEGCSREEFDELLHAYQSRAMRTLGFAVEQHGVMTFLGVVGIADPIRDDVAEAIDTCMNSAGVRVIIVTSDTPGTARYVVRPSR